MQINNRAISLLLLITIFVSCRDDSVIRVPSFGDGPNVRIVIQTPSINFFSDLSQANVMFDIYSANKNLQTVDLKVFKTTGGVRSDTVSVVSFKQSDFDAKGGQIIGFQIPLSSIATALKLSGVAGFKGADDLTFLNYTTLTSGVTYPSKTVNNQLNTSPAIQTSASTTSFTSNFKVSLVCPSSIIEGSYTATQQDNDVWFGGPNPLPSTNQVTITKVAGTTNQYLISDVTAGGYFACCASLGFKKDQPAIISDICLAISVTKNAGAQISIGQGKVTGSWDAATKTLIVHYDDVSNKSLKSGYDLWTKFVKN